MPAPYPNQKQMQLATEKKTITKVLNSREKSFIKRPTA